MPQQLKTYEEMIKGYQDLVQEITNPVLSIMYESIIKEVKQGEEIRKSEHQPNSKILQIYPPSQNESNTITVERTRETEQIHDDILPNVQIITNNNSLNYERIIESTKNLPTTQNQHQSGPSKMLETMVQSQINPLELLVEFGLKHCVTVNPKHLTDRVRQVGYCEAFRSLRIKSRPIIDDIDKYLKSLKIPGLTWKSLNIKMNTLFPYVRTKYD